MSGVYFNIFIFAIKKDLSEISYFMWRDVFNYEHHGTPKRSCRTHKCTIKLRKPKK